MPDDHSRILVTPRYCRKSSPPVPSGALGAHDFEICLAPERGSADDPLGEMQTEVECHAGTGVQIFSFNRWGDYSTMSVDPQDDCTFWYTQEYYETTIPRDRRTRICAFRFDNCLSGSNPGQQP